MAAVYSLLRNQAARFPEVSVGLVLLSAASLSIIFTRVEGGIALFWPGSAIAAALLIRARQFRKLLAATCVLTALTLASGLVGHRPWRIAAVFALINFLEIAMMVGAFRHVWKFPYPTISINQAAIMTAVFGIAIPGFTACWGGLFLFIAYGIPWHHAAAQWWSAHTIGACLLGPPIILSSKLGLKRLLHPALLPQNALMFLTCAAGCYLTIRYVRFPFVSISLLLLIASFRLGGFGAALLSFSVGFLMTNLWAFGVRPLGLDPALTAPGTLIGLPVLALTAMILPPIAVGLGTDARRAAAKALRTSERRFRESMAHSPIGMLIAELDGTWRFTNHALQQMLGYSAAEFQAMPPGGPSKSEHWKQSGSRLGQLIGGEIASYEVAREFRHSDGRWIWTHVAVSLLRDEDGSPLHLIAQIESLEARKKAEATLAAERERLRVTLSAISDAVITVDADLRINYVNSAAEAILATDMKSMTGRRLGEVMHLVDPASSRTAANLVGQAAYHGTVVKREQACLLHRADGTVCYVFDTVSPVISEAGVLTGLMILRDGSADVARHRELEHRALHDPLTGLANRTEFNDRLRAIFQRASLTGQTAAVIAIDLDKFKAVNDSAGHAAGDAVLCKVAEACRKAVRTSDVVARLGGDEFAIILDNCGEERSTRIAQQLLAALNPVTIEWGNTTHLVYASLGLAFNTAVTDETAWMRGADQACYAAKYQGRARLQIAASRTAITPRQPPNSSLVD